MNFEARQAQRHRQLERVMFAAKLLAVVYLLLHGAVALLAFKLTGAGAGILTLLTLGFGDLYWALRWAGLWQGLGFDTEAGETVRHGPAIVAGVAAVSCFASWLGRPHFQRWAQSFATDMVADGAHELETLLSRQEADTTEQAEPRRSDTTETRKGDGPTT